MKKPLGLAVSRAALIRSVLCSPTYELTVIVERSAEFRVRVGGVEQGIGQNTAVAGRKLKDLEAPDSLVSCGLGAGDHEVAHRSPGQVCGSLNVLLDRRRDPRSQALGVGFGPLFRGWHRG